MAQKNYSELMLQETVKVIPWGIMLLIVVLIGSSWIKQDVKEGIEFTVQTTADKAKSIVLDSSVITPLKQNIKEAVEFAMKTAISEAKNAVLDTDTFTRIKQNTKEAIEFTSKTAAREFNKSRQ